MGSNSGRHLVHGGTPSIFGPLPEEETPPVTSIALPTVDNVGHTPPGLVNPPPEGDATVLSTIPTTALVVKLTSPIVPPYQTEEERQYLLVVTALIRRLNLESTGVIPLGHGDHFGWRSGLLKSQDGSSSPWTHLRKKAD